MRTVYLITTGGTIEKAYAEESGTVLNRTSKIDRYLQLLRLPGWNVRVVPLMNKESLEMTEEDRIWLVSQLSLLLPDENPVIITHGTDTMVETGLYVARKVSSLYMPIIFTGAMTPLGFEGSDGLQNLAEALLAARLLRPGVFIVMHGQVFPVDGVRKDKRLAAFVAVEETQR
jgi:L-asparaginase